MYSPGCTHALPTCKALMTLILESFLSYGEITLTVRWLPLTGIEPFKLVVCISSRISNFIPNFIMGVITDHIGIKINPYKVFPPFWSGHVIPSIATCVLFGGDVNGKWYSQMPSNLVFIAVKTLAIAYGWLYSSTNCRAFVRASRDGPV